MMGVTGIFSHYSENLSDSHSKDIPVPYESEETWPL